jgi:hypothetical protein
VKGGFVRRTFNDVVLMAASIGLSVLPLFAQTQVSALLRQLESRKTTDSAKAQLLQLGRSDPKARQYLAIHLPLLIAARPESPHPDVDDVGFLRREWVNAVLLAGSLKLVEAVPALTKQIDVRTTPQNLWGNNPAGYALCQIGDPAIRSVRRVLDDGNQEQRTLAAYVLQEMDSPKSMAALRDYVNHGKDPYLANGLHSYFLGPGSTRDVPANRRELVPDGTNRDLLSRWANYSETARRKAQGKANAITLSPGVSLK